MPIDCVLYADTTMEFPEMEAHIAKLDNLLCQKRGIHITTLRHPHGFEWLMFEEPKRGQVPFKSVLKWVYHYMEMAGQELKFDGAQDS